MAQTQPPPHPTLPLPAGKSSAAWIWGFLPQPREVNGGACIRDGFCLPGSKGGVQGREGGQEAVAAEA